MIAFIRGTVVSVSAPHVVVDVAGVGLELTATARCLGSLQVGTTATVPASVVVREDSWTMFGFLDADERACFVALQAAKGVGPKVAISLLGALTPDQLRAAVSSGDAQALTAAQGIGTRGAQRLVIDLRDRLGQPSGSAPALVPVQQTGGWRSDVASALVGLGWTQADASAAVARVAAEAMPGGAGAGPDGAPDPAALLRLALRSLDRASGVS